jgi:hypothetical protein
MTAYGGECTACRVTTPAKPRTCRACRCGPRGLHEVLGNTRENTGLRDRNPPFHEVTTFSTAFKGPPSARQRPDGLAVNSEDGREQL